MVPLQRIKPFAAIPIAIIVVLVVVFLALGIKSSMLPPVLLPILSTLFLGVIMLTGAAICAWGYKASGSWVTVLTGGGLLSLGLAGPAAGWLALAAGQNVNVTLYNSAALLASLCFLCSSIFVLEGTPGPQRVLRWGMVAAVYGAVGAILAVVTALAWLGRLPVFFVPGVGPTAIREVVLGTATGVFAVSICLFLLTYIRARAEFLYWCLLGLGVITLGLLASMLYGAFGDPVNWMARFAQYVGSLYFLAAAVVLREEARSKQVGVSELVDRFLNQARANYQLLVETATDAIVSIDGQGRVLMWNAAAEQMFGYSRAEAMGSLITELIFPSGKRGFLGHDNGAAHLLDGEKSAKTMEVEATTRDGREVPCEVSLATAKLSLGWLSSTTGTTTTTLVLRDVSERKKAEQALRTSEERYRTLFTHMSSGYAYCQMVFDDKNQPVDFIYLEVNDAFEKLTGLKKNDVIGKRVTEAIPTIGEANPEIIRTYGRVVLTGEPTALEVFFKPLQIWLDIAVYRPNKGHFAAVFENVTERKRAEEALRRSEAQAQALIRYAPTAIFEVDYRGPRFLSVNDAMCSLSGYTREELFAMEPTAILDDDGKKLFADRMRRQLAGEEISDVVEYTVKKKDGSVMFVTLNVSFSKNRPFTALVIGHDVTERKRTEAKVKDIADKYSSLFNNTSDGVWIHNLDGIIVEVNNAYCAMSGYRCEDIVGMPISQLEAVETPVDIAEHIRKVLAQGGHDRFESKHRRKDGSVFDVDITALYLEREGGQIAVFVRDITERNRMEQLVRLERDKLTAVLDSMEDGVAIESMDFGLEYVNPSMASQYGAVNGQKCFFYFNGREDACPWCNNQEVAAGKSHRREFQSNRTGRTYEVTDAPLKNVDGTVSKLSVWHDITERKKIEQMKDEFIGMVSHELKTPLTVLIGALRTAASEGLSAEEVKGLFEDAAGSAEYLNGIVDNLLELSRAQADRLVLQRKPSDIAQIAGHAVRMLQGKASRHLLVMDIPAGLPYILADPVRTERIIYNLVDNAIKYSPDGGEIRLSVRQQDDHLVVSVSDQGIGIAAEDQVRLFHSFERLGAHVDSAVQGVGLGLRVCRILVEAQGGRIWLDSQPGKGSTFYFMLPVAK